MALKVNHACCVCVVCDSHHDQTRRGNARVPFFIRLVSSLCACVGESFVSVQNQSAFSARKGFVSGIDRNHFSINMRIGVAGEALFSISAQGVFPVSYTHLTLPTKRIV